MILNSRCYIALIVLTFTVSSRCDLVTELNPILTQQLFNAGFNAIKWCGNCQFLAVGGNGLGRGLVGAYQFDQTTESLSLTGTTTLGTNILSVQWCPECNFLAAAGGAITGGIIQIYSFDSSNPGIPQPVGMPTILGLAGSIVTSIDWCQSCSLLAATSNQGFFGSSTLQVYGFDTSLPGNGLVAIDGPTTSINSILSIKWCPDCTHLVAAGMNGLYVYTFNDSSPALILTGSYQNNAEYVTVDVCNNCNYIAAGGTDLSSRMGIIDVYRFDPRGTPSLSLVTSTSFAPTGLVVTSLKWCQGCDNLAAVQVVFDSSETGTLRVYNFDSSSATLSLPQTYTLSLNPVGFNCLDWCGNCCYIAIAGINEPLQTDGIIQLYKSNTCSTGPTNLTAQKICHRFPTQVDIINTICWDAVANAVAYNVYADAELTVRLATITTTPLCYSQHQICLGRSSTYYVTAVDGAGNESAPSVVTI